LECRPAGCRAVFIFDAALLVSFTTGLSPGASGFFPAFTFLPAF
jgi:hypothetical protein